MSESPGPKFCDYALLKFILLIEEEIVLNASPGKQGWLWLRRAINRQLESTHLTL